MKVSRKSFVMEKIDDADADLSWIGKYADQAGPDDRTIDREERGDTRRRGDYRYFIAAMSGEDTGNPESVEQAYKRMEDYGHGWYTLGIRARVTLDIPHGKGYIPQTIKSPGLWGIESDSEEGYFAEVFDDECAVLEDMLKELGKIEIVD